MESRECHGQRSPVFNKVEDKTYTRIPGERGISGTLRERRKSAGGMLDITRLSGAIPSLQAGCQEKVDTASTVEQAKDKPGPASKTRLSTIRMDEYVLGENPAPIGLCQVTQDEGGSRKVVFDASAKGEGEPKAVSEAPEPPKEGTPADASEKADKKVESKSCACSTDQVDREIKRLEEKQEELKLKASRYKDNPDEWARPEHQLARVESELRVGSTDFYRWQHAQFAYSQAASPIPAAQCLVFLFSTGSGTAACLNGR